MPQPAPQPQMPLRQKLERMQNLMVFPALTVMVFLRHRLGYRLVHPLRLFVMAGLLFVASSFARSSPNIAAFQLFAGLMLLAGLVQRFRRWLELGRGVAQHSFYIGDSIFAFTWLPAFILRNRRFTRFFDPLVSVVTGACVLGTCPSLGAWLIFSGFALRVVEDTLYRKKLNGELDMVDGIITSEVQAKTVEHFRKGPQDTRQQQEAAQGIPTGLSPDLEQRIQERQRQQQGIKP